MLWNRKSEKELNVTGKEGAQEDIGKLNSDELARLYESTVKDVKEGQIVKSRIIEIRPEEVVVDIGYKSEGVISIKEFPEPDKLKVGDEVEVLLELKENESGSVVVSKQKADKLQGWERIVSTNKEGDILTGKATRKVKGGIMVNIGMEAFLPASLAGLRTYSNLDELIGHEMEYKIIKINKAG